MPTEIIPTAPIQGGRIFKRLTRDELGSLAQHHISYNHALVLADRISALWSPDVQAVLAEEEIHLIGFEVIAKADVPGAPFPNVNGGIGIMVFWLTPEGVPAENPHIYAVALQGTTGPTALMPATIGTGPSDGGLFVAHYDGDPRSITPEKWCERLSVTAIDTGDPTDGPVDGEHICFEVTNQPFIWLDDVWYQFGGKITLLGNQSRMNISYEDVRYRHIHWLLGVLGLPGDGGAENTPDHPFFNIGIKRVPNWGIGVGQPIEDSFTIGSTDQWPVLKSGAQGDQVYALQYLLQEHTYTIEADGVFGPQTQGAIESFQYLNNISVSGNADGDTWAGLVITVQRTDQNSAVRAVQQLLQLPTDGIFGTDTEAAVTQFQSAEELTPNGIVDIDTWQKLLVAPVRQPVPVQDPIQQEWNAHPRIHHHFHNPRFQNYQRLRPLYQTRGIPKPAEYINQNIIQVQFFGRGLPVHQDLRQPLLNVEQRLQNNHPRIADIGGFVPRTTRRGALSNHALGRAIDINHRENPHITSQDEMRVIQAVTGLDLRQRNQGNIQAMRQASQRFQNQFTEQWVQQQQQHMNILQNQLNRTPTPQLRTRVREQDRLVRAIRNSRGNLDGYARRGFFNLEQQLVEALIAEGFEWGGHWQNEKDFMHFELP